MLMCVLSSVAALIHPQKKQRQHVSVVMSTGCHYEKLVELSCCQGD